MSCDIEGRRHWGQIFLMYRIPALKVVCPQSRLPSKSHDIEGKYFNFSRIMSKNANFQTLGPKGPQKPPNLHIIPNVGSINPIKYVLSPNRNPQNCKVLCLHTFTFTMTGSCLQREVACPLCEFETNILTHWSMWEGFTYFFQKLAAYIQ